MDYFLGLLINGVVVGSIYSLIALGFVLIYKATEVVNFAQGELLMIGAYICLEVIVSTGMPFFAGFFTTLIFMTLLALAIEKLVLRRMMGAPVMSIVMATIGIGIVLRSFVLLVWGASNRPFPSVFPQEGIDLFGLVTVSQVYLYAFFLCLIFMVSFGVFFQYTRWGLVMRAVSSSQKAAESLGVPLVRVFALAWVVSAVVSGIGGILAANISGLTPDLSAYGVRVFPAVILGGLDSIVGATISGVIIGVLENFSGGYLRNLTGLSGLGPVAPFFVLILILWIRPTGLMGRKEVDKL